MTSTIIVTGADSKYQESAFDLITSIQDTGFACDFGIVDAGLQPTYRQKMLDKGCQICNVSIKSPLREAAQHVPQGWRSALLKPYISELFPRYETYIFLDADTWVQQRFALDYLQTYSAGGQLAIVSQRSRFHDRDSARGNGVEFNIFGQPLRANWYTMFSHKSKLTLNDKKLLASNPILNAGVFSLQAGSELWGLWQTAVIEAAHALPRGRQYAADQIGLGLAVYRNQMTVALLPETCNWMSVWRFDEDTGLFTTTQPPFDPVGIIHLAGIDPRNPIREVKLSSGSEKLVDLTYRGIRSYQSNMC
jgi:hypothetical protein